MSAPVVPDRSAGSGGAAAAAAVVARRWVDWYAGLVGTEAAERRRAEIESDLWEQLADARESGRRPSAVAASIAWRVAGGMPDDLLWVRTQRLAMRGRQADRKASAMNALGHVLARWWWAAGAALIAAFYLWIGIDNLVGAYAPLPEAAVQCFVYATVAAVGVGLRVKAPRLSATLIAAVALGTMLVWWAPPVMVLGGVVLIGALVEVARLGAPTARARAGGVVGAILIGASGILPMLGLGAGAGWAALVGIALAVAALAGGILLLVATRNHVTEPTLAAPASAA